MGKNTRIAPVEPTHKNLLPQQQAMTILAQNTLKILESHPSLLALTTFLAEVVVVQEFLSWSMQFLKINNQLICGYNSMELCKPENTLIYEHWQPCTVGKVEEVRAVQWVGQDAMRIAVAGNRKGEGVMGVWEVGVGDADKTKDKGDRVVKEVKLFRVPGPIITAKVSASGAHLACLCQGTSKPLLYSVSSSTDCPIFQFPSLPKKPNSLTFSNNQKLLVSSDNSISILPLVASSQPQHLPQYHKDSIKSLSWLTDSEFAAATLTGNIYIWDSRAGKPVKKYGGHFGSVEALTALATNVLVSGGFDGQIKLWELRRDRCYQYTKQNCPVVRLEKASVDGQVRFLSGAKDGKIKIWDDAEIFSNSGHTSQIRDICVRDNLVISAEEKTPRLLIWGPTPSAFCC